MPVDTTEKVIKSGQNWEVDYFRPEDAAGVARLFRTVYGDDYPVKTFTDTEKLVEENAAKRTISSVARTEKGDIIGHNALFRSAPFDLIYELGAGLVLPEYRGGSAGFGVVEHSCKVVPRKFGIEAIFGEPVCNHVRMQKICERLDYVTCAVEVDLMPAEVYSKEMSASGRVAALLAFSVFKPKEQDVYLPAVYEENLRFIYGALDYGFRLMPSSEEVPDTVKTKIEPSIFDFAQVARYAVHEAGVDLAEAMAREEKAAEQRGVIVHQAWLKLSWPWVGRAVELLRSRGYFFGGALPRWFDVDGLLMQKILGKPNWDEIQIYSDRARSILEMAKADWAGRAPGH
jgi:hypothetical protein